ncbi:hypothetical protein [Helicobacter zhangjianzhongii]|uniref:hypothetical protein n=1 Tax=Helicobacter zhangjianzhongii TaxID=2974574 RepID=UPI00255439E5|nr:hypothetical protein [Helicobacter sp. XJK30-2]
MRAVLAAWQSTDSALAELTTLESTFVFSAVFSQVDSNASLFCAFLESACADMDCHALRSKARNDDKRAFSLKSWLCEKVDSRGCAFFVVCASVLLWDSRIVELESWLCVFFG